MNKPAAVYTECISPPIPQREFDWYARFSFHDGDTDLTGYGETEESAVIDLLQNAMEYDGDGSEQEVILNLALAQITDQKGTQK